MKAYLNGTIIVGNGDVIKSGVVLVENSSIDKPLAKTETKKVSDTRYGDMTLFLYFKATFCLRNHFLQLQHYLLVTFMNIAIAFWVLID